MVVLPPCKSPLFSTRTYLIPVTLKDERHVSNALQNFFEEIGDRRMQSMDHKNKKETLYMQSDRGTEFYNASATRVYNYYNVQHYSTRAGGGHAYAAEQKIREVKKLFAKLRAAGKLVKTGRGWVNSVEDVEIILNNSVNQKYMRTPDLLDENNIGDPKTTLIHLLRNKKLAKKNKPLNIGDKVYVTKKRVGEKDAPHIFTKPTTRTEDRGYWQRNKIYIISQRAAAAQMTGGSVGPLYVYFLREGEREIKQRFYREDLAAVDTDNTTTNDTIQTFVNNID